MRKSWPWQSLLAVAIAASGTAWAQTGATQGGDSANATNADPGAATNGAPVMPRAGQDNGASQDDATSNSGPSPRDQPNPGLRIDPRMHRLPPKRGDNGNGGADPGAQGNDNGTNGPDATPPPGHVKPQNPAVPQAPIFPANPPPPADPGQPGNPVTPTVMRLT